MWSPRLAVVATDVSYVNACVCVATEPSWRYADADVGIVAVEESSLYTDSLNI